MIGGDVDVLRLPTPFIHAHDGGRYIQTFGLNIVRTPDGSWTNFSINRMMLQPHAAEVLHLLRSAGLPVATCWTVLESANHLMVIAMRPDWHETTNASSADVGRRIGDIVFSSKAGFGIPKLLLVEDDFDQTNVAEVLWAFASRAHPSNGEIYFPDEPQNALPIFLSSGEKSAFKTTKVVHNGLLADRFPIADRPVRSDLEHAWPAELRERVLRNWERYGYAAAAMT